MASHGAVVFDGTLGPSGVLEGPDYTIKSTAGTQVGQGLFHSFREFSLESGEQATFTGEASISHVLARVTGGQKSEINGTLRSDIPDADLFFVNPAGVVFGNDSAIQVDGSLYVATADYVELGSGGRFDAGKPERSVLVSEPPAAFGFLERQPAPIVFESALGGHELSVSDGHSLSVVAGDILVDRTSLIAPDGDLLVVGAGPNSRVPLAGVTDLADLEGGSDVDVGLLSRLSAGVAEGGNVTIQGRSLEVGDSALIEARSQDQDGEGKVVIQVAEHMRTRLASQILSVAEGAASGGGIRIQGRELDVDGEGIVSLIASSSATLSRGGDITLSAEAVTLQNGGLINSTALEAGDAGDVRIEATQLKILSGETATATGILANSEPSDKRIAGDSGDIEIRTKELTMIGAVDVTAGTFGSGEGGDVRIEADSILMDGRGLVGTAAGIASQANGGFFGGASGDVEVQTRTLEIKNGIGISTTSDGYASAGDVRVRAEEISLDGGGLVNVVSFLRGPEQTSFTGIDASTGNPEAVLDSLGSGGMIEIEAKNLRISNGAAVSSGTSTQGPGGAIRVTAESLTVAAGEDNIDDSAVETGFFSTSGLGPLRPSRGGVAGSIHLEANEIHLLPGSEVNTRTWTTGHGGDIRIMAERLDADGTLFLASGQLRSGTAGSVIIELGRGGGTLVNSRVLTQSLNGNAGGIEILSRGDLDLVSGTGVSSDAKGTGGDILLRALGGLSLSDGSVRAVAGVDGGNIALHALREIQFSGHVDVGSRAGNQGGQIVVGTPFFVVAPEFIGDVRVGRFDASADPRAGFGGDIRIGESILADLSQMNATGGVAGNVETNVQGLELTGSLAPLERFLLHLDDQLPERCEVTETEAVRGSFRVAGSSRIPEEPEDRSGSLLGR